jgi:methylthioribose-1-phosphate isomerase
VSFHTVALREDHVELLDQRLLPGTVRYLELRTVEEVACAIEEMAVRGAPAIGVTAAFGVALELARVPDEDLPAALERACDRLARTRPTAVNLTWALERMRGRVRAAIDTKEPAVRVRSTARELALRIHDEDVRICREIGAAGAELLGEQCRVLTHCNAGALATAGYGTALGVIRSAAVSGHVKRVIACETRPFLQGARLTAWELLQEGIPVTLITDSMAGALMSRGEIDAVIVGADRIAANGDVANKIGTYTHAVLARHHGIPFYVAAPLSTVDLETRDGSAIPIEYRSPEEVLTLAGQRIAPEGAEALHPAFDVTPAELVTAIITERGVIHSPFGPTLARQKATESQPESGVSGS